MVAGNGWAARNRNYRRTRQGRAYPTAALRFGSRKGDQSAGTKENAGVEPPINVFVAPSMPPLMGETEFAVSLPLRPQRPPWRRRPSPCKGLVRPATGARFLNAKCQVATGNVRVRSGDEFIAADACLLQGCRCGL